MLPPLRTTTAAAQRNGYADDKDEEGRDEIGEGAPVAYSLEFWFASGPGKDGDDFVSLGQRLGVAESGGEVILRGAEKVQTNMTGGPNRREKSPENRVKQHVGGA